MLGGITTIRSGRRTAHSATCHLLCMNNMWPDPTNSLIQSGNPLGEDHDENPGLTESSRRIPCVRDKLFIRLVWRALTQSLLHTGQGESCAKARIHS